MVKKKLTNEEYEENIKEEFSITQGEVQDYGMMIIQRVQGCFDGLINEPDNCWTIEGEYLFYRVLSKFL